MLVLYGQFVNDYIKFINFCSQIFEIQFTARSYFKTKSFENVIVKSTFGGEQKMPLRK